LIQQVIIQKMKIINYPINKDYFIGANFIDKKICKEIIEYYKKNNHLVIPATIGHNEKENVVDETVKSGNEMIFENVNFLSRFPNYTKSLNECLLQYLNTYPYCNKQYFFNIHQTIKIQHYKKNKGFKQWHMENSGIGLASKRVLVFMTYLNDVKNGGTEFFHQGITTPAKQGLTLIWPAGWTHVHRGQISKTKEKYIVTGWYSFSNE